MTLQLIMSLVFILLAGALGVRSVLFIVDRLRDPDPDDRLLDVQADLQALIEDNRVLREEMGALRERVDFTERLLVEKTPLDRSPPGD